MKRILCLILLIAVVAMPLGGMTFADESNTTYHGEAQGFGGLVSADVTVEADGRITDILVEGMSETPDRGGAAIKTLTEQILVSGSLDGIDTVSGATVTSNAVFSAVRTALETKEIAQGRESVAIAFTPGVYTGKGFGFHSYVTVEVELDAEKILSVTVTDNSGETPYLRDVAADTIPAAIVENQSLGVDSVTGATWGSRAIIEAVADCVEQASSSEVVDELRRVPVMPAEGEDKLYEGFDLAVVGGGGSGIIAAAKAVDSGLKVIVIEAADRWGGVSEIAGGGTLAIGTELQKNAEQKDGSVVNLYEKAETTVDEVFKQKFEEFRASSHFQENDLLLKRFLQATGEAADFLSQKYGMQFTASNTSTLRYGTQGTRFAPVAEQLEEQGAVMLLHTRGEHLIMENGSVAGVEAVDTKTGAAVIVRAKAVILATGGASNNSSLMEEFAPDYNDYYMNWGGSTANGDGIQMAWEAGAEQTWLGTQSHNEGLPLELHNLFDFDITTGNVLYANLVYEPMLRISRNTGRRISDETIMYTPHYQGNRSMTSMGAILIVDQVTIDDLMENGSKTRPWRSKLYSEPMKNPDYTGLNLQEQIDEVVEYSMKYDSGFAYKADSIEELSEMLGLDPVVVAKEVEKYNTAVETGVDEEFDRNADTLVYTITEGPFYAFETKIRNLGTWGGIETDETLAVYDGYGRLIPGLYSAGLDALGWIGTSYFVDTTTLGWMTASGYMAGESAVAYIQGK